MEVREILEEAKSESDRIVEDAKAKAERTRKRMTEEKSIELDKRLQQDLARAKADARNNVLNARFRLFEQTFAEFEDYLKRIVENGSKYQPRLKRLIVEAATKLSGNELEILTNSRDKEFVSYNLSQLKSEISSLKGQPTRLTVSKETITSLGGVVVRTSDGKQIFNNTLEARTDEFRKESGQIVYKMIFAGAEE